MCWPELVGGVEVEERRPRNWNEPRRKRLNFVRGERYRADDWRVTTPFPPRFTDQERWDRRRAWEMEQQRLMHPIPHPPLQGHHDPRILPMPPAPPHLHQIQPGHQPGFDQGGHHGHQHQLDHHSHHSEENIIGGHDQRDDHDDPKIIPIKPHKSHLPKGLKAHAKKPRGHKKKRSISSSSSDDSSAFSEGFRAGRRSLSRRPVLRGRSRSRLTDDSFEDLMPTRFRSRSRRW